MGVDTKKFGPRGWIVLESVARAYDEMPVKSRRLSKLVLEFFVIFASIIPCVYCRISFRGFTDLRKPYSDEANIKLMLAKGKAMAMVYALHNCVSNKLKNQEVMNKPSEKKRILAKWDKKHITYETALEKKFYTMDSPRFWNAFILFLGLVMCDYRPEEMRTFHRFFHLVGDIMTNAGYITSGAHYLHSLAMVETLWSKYMDWDTRMDIVWILYKRMFDLHEWEYPFDRKKFETFCKKSTVGQCA